MIHQENTGLLIPRDCQWHRTIQSQLLVGDLGQTLDPVVGYSKTLVTKLTVLVAELSRMV
jgi:hypothetical protein